MPDPANSKISGLPEALAIDGNTEFPVNKAGITSKVKLSTITGYLGAPPVQSVFGRIGNITLLSSDIATALGYTALNKAGDTITGYGYLNFNASAQRINATGQDGFSFVLANLNIGSWHSIGMSNTGVTGQTIPSGFYAHRFSTRNGDVNHYGALAHGGVLTTNTAKISTTSGVVTLDTGGYVAALTSGTPVAAGTGAVVNERFSDSSGNTYTATAVGAGTVTTIVMNGGFPLFGTPPSNPISLSTRSGSATGVTVNLTWTRSTSLVLNPVGNVTITNNLTVGGTLSVPAFTPTTSATIPTNGIYSPAVNTLGWAINSTAKMTLISTSLSPALSDGIALGSTSKPWSDLFLASGGVINFNNGDVNITHSSNLLTLTGGDFTLGDAATTTANLNLSGSGSGSRVINYYTASDKRAELGIDSSEEFFLTMYNTSGANSAKVFDISHAAGSKADPLIFIFGPDYDASTTLAHARPSARGSGYTVGNVLTFVGGTLKSGYTASTVTVATVSSGAVTSYTVTNAGAYSTQPSTPIAVTGGTGTGATIDPGWNLLSNINIDVRGDVKARSFTLYSTHYTPLYVADDGIGTVPTFAAIKANTSGWVRNNGAYVTMGSTGDAIMHLRTTGGGIDGLNVSIVTATGYAGGRTAIVGTVLEHKDSVLSVPRSTRGIVGGQFNANSNNNSGGIADGYNVNQFGVGNTYAFNTQTTLGPGGTYRRALVGYEMDIRAEQGAQFVSGSGLLIPFLSTHKVGALREWAATLVSNTNPTSGTGNWKVVHQIGSHASGWPVLTNGYLLWAKTGVTYRKIPAIASGGLHLREVDFTDFVMRWNGGDIRSGADGGQIQIGNASLSSTAQGAVLNSDATRTLSVSIATPGAGYNVGDIVRTTSQDVFIKVDSVLTSGINSATNASAIVITSAGHTFTNGTLVSIIIPYDTQVAPTDEDSTTSNDPINPSHVIGDGSVPIGMSELAGVVISGVTHANPGVFTATNHGLPNGTRIRLWSIVQNWIIGAIPASAGSGYAVNDILTVSGGTGVTPAQIKVTAVSAGAITSFIVQTDGRYTTSPANPVTLTGGTGAGATATLTFLSGGMGQLSGSQWFTIRNRTTNSFTLEWMNGNAVETTRFTPWVVGGKVRVNSYMIANVGAYGANTFELRTDQNGVIDASGWTSYISGGRLLSTIPDSVVLFRNGWEKIGNTTNVATESLIRSGLSYGSGLTVNLVWGGASNLQLQSTGNATFARGILASSATVFGVSLQTTSILQAKTASLASITILEGGVYASKPTVVFAAPLAGGVNATATIDTMGASSGTPSGAGTAYLSGEYVTVSGGTLAGGGNTVRFRITRIDELGAVQALSVDRVGNYTTLPSSPVSVTGGSGTGLTITTLWKILTATLSAAGSNYPESPSPAVTFSGGGEVVCAQVSVAMTAVNATLSIQPNAAATTIGGTLGVTGATTLSSTLAVTGAATLSSTLVVTGAITGASIIVTGISLPATNGMYLPAANTLGWAINGVGELQLTATALSPMVSDSNALGTTSLMWADLFLATGAVINFNAGNLTLTHSAGVLTSNGAIVATSFAPSSLTLPANGLYLPTTNTIGLSANTTQILTGTSTVVAVKPTTASSSSATGALTVAGGLGVAGIAYVGGTIRSDSAIYAFYGTDSQVHINNSSIEIGLPSRSIAATAFIDFHSSPSSPDYDVRVQAQGGSSATSGSGTLTLMAASIVIAGPSGSNGGSLTINTASNGSAGTATPSGITLSDSSIGSTWDPVNPWQKIEFYTADTSTGGPGGRVRIGPVAESSLGGASRLAIFQTATANTFVEKWALTSTGRMLVGGRTDDGVHTIQAAGSVALYLNATTAPANLSGTVFRAVQADATSAYMMLDVFAATGYLAFRRANGTNAAMTTLAATNIIGSVVARGYDGTAFSTDHARMVFKSTETWTAFAHGTQITFSTTSNTTTNSNDRLTIDHDGSVIFGSAGTGNTLSILTSTSNTTPIAFNGAFSGGMNFTTLGSLQFQIAHAASAVNYISVTGGGSGTGASILTAGADANINLILDPKGTGIVSVISPVTVSGQLTSTIAMDTTAGGGQIHLNGATGNRIDWNTNGVGPPAFTTRSAGTKLVLYPSVGPSNVDFGFGIDGGTLWSSVRAVSDQFKWYGGTTLAATLTGAGALSVGSSGNTLTITPNTTSGTAITLVGGGTGGLTFAASGGVQVAVTNTASAVNYVAITGAATGSGVKLSALGSDAVIHLRLAAKGSGSIIAENNIVLQATKVLVVDSLQVVGARDTGWTAMTGTTNKATVYDPSTVTLAQLAGRVAALQNALGWHGLIGA